MEYLVFSDSHGAISPMRRAIQAHPHVAGVLFCGDGLRDVATLCCEYPDLPFYEVRGNCDVGETTQDIPEERLLLLEGKRILLMHGHKYGVKGGLGAAIAHAQEREADVLLFGHTHRVCDKTECCDHGVLTLANPGSIGRAVDGFLHYGVLTIRQGALLFSTASIERMC